MTTVVSLGRSLAVAAKSYPLPLGTSTSRGSSGLVELLRGDGAYATFEAIFRSQPMVYAVCTKGANGVARNPLKVYEVDPDGESRRRVRSHPLAQLIRRPHPRGSEFGLKAGIALSMFVQGEAILAKFRPGPGLPPTELWPIPMKHVSIIEDASGPIGYEVTVNGVTVILGPEDVVHFSLPGGSPLRPLARTLALEDAAITWQGQSLQNGMTQRGAFVTDQRLNDASLPRLRAELEQLYAGVENAGKVALLEQGLKFQNVGISAVDAELINQRKLSREEVCAAYDMAPALFGLAQANFGQTLEYRRLLFDSIATRLTLIEETLQAQLVDPEPSWDGVFVEFDTNDMLRPDPEARARTYLMMQQAGVNSVNERRRYENLPRIDDPMADAIFVPVNMQPVGSDLPALPAADPNAGGTPMQGIGDRVVSDAITASFAKSDQPASMTVEEQ